VLRPRLVSARVMPVETAKSLEVAAEEAELDQHPAVEEEEPTRRPVVELLGNQPIVRSLCLRSYVIGNTWQARSMPTEQVHSEGVQVVILGNFNPAIFSPGWLLAKELIRQDDYDLAAPQVIVPQLSIFTTGWLRCEATPQRLVLGTEEPLEFERVRDVATSILTLLSQTPINMLGINRYFHAAVPERKWHAIGDYLTPKAIWERALVLPGMQDITIRSVRQDDFAGQINVTVQPSALVQPGVFIFQNDHFLLKKVQRQPSSRAEFFSPEIIAELQAPTPTADCIPLAKAILGLYWQQSFERADNLRDLVLSIGDD